MIRLVASDLDQTLFGADLVISARVRATIAEVMRSGVVFTIATGREAAVAARFARELEIAAPIICTQGACIYDPVHDKILQNTTLARELLPRLIDAGRDHGWNFHFEMSNRLILPASSAHPPAFFELLRYSKWSRAEDLLAALTDPPHKMVVTLNSPEGRDRLIEEMRRAIGDIVTIVPSHPFLVEALPAGVNKGHGLAWLAGYLSIPRAAVMTLGDSDADISMIEWAGVGVAMRDSSPGALAAADWIAPTVGEDGAAVAMEKFVLNRTGHARLLEK
jgi:Cof subfamily protein (haloacid dehalogenase superfamily)